MSTDAPKPEAIDLQLQLKWPSPTFSGAQYANMFAVTPGFPTQGGTEEVMYLLAGSAGPPVLSDAEAVTNFQMNGGQIPIQIVSALVFPLSRARELVDLLEKQIRAADERTAEART